MEAPLRKIEIQTETACHDLFSFLLVCMAITRYKLHFERVLRIFLGISPALLMRLRASEASEELSSFGQFLEFFWPNP